MSANLCITDGCAANGIYKTYHSTYINPIHLAIIIRNTGTSDRSSYGDIRKSAICTLIYTSNNSTYSATYSAYYQHILILLWHYMIDINIIYRITGIRYFSYYGSYKAISIYGELSSGCIEIIEFKCRIFYIANHSCYVVVCATYGEIVCDI